MKHKDILCKSLLIVILTFVAYAPAMRCGFIWDDDDYVTGNVTLRSLEGLRRIWFEPGAVHQYYPIVYSSFWVEYQLWGLHPLGYHLINVALHAANAVLVGLVLRRLSVPGAFLAAAIFALHPVHVESVAWVTERKNVLSGLFYLSSALFYLRFSGIGGQVEKPESRSQNIFYASSLACFVAALLSKSVTCTLPAVLLLLAWWKRPRLEWRRDLLPLAPMFALGALMGMVTIWMEKTSVGAQGADWAIGFADRVMIAGRAIWFYIFKLIWPQDLTFIYPRWSLRWESAWEYLMPAAALGVLAMLWIHRQRLGRAPAVAATFFVLTLLPALGFINYYPMIYSFVADHFQYLASIGLIAAFAATIQDSRFPPRGTGRGSPLWGGKIRYAGPVIVLLLAVLTWKQAHIYKDEKTLWEDTLRKNPSAWMAHNNLGGVLSDEGRLEEAITHYYEALKLKPDHEMAHYNLGIVFARQGKLDEAAAHYSAAIQINPGYAQAHNNLGGVLCQGGLAEQGIAEYMEALRIDPNYADVHSNLGVAFLGRGDLEKALFHCHEAIRIEPELAEAYNNLGTVLVRQGKLAEAVETFAKAIAINPNYATAHANLGRALTEQGKSEATVFHYKEAIRLDPERGLQSRPQFSEKKGKGK
ncbi:MAG: tetratricopeptide repeat protein [Verrucomicrobiales bacterium]|nr:tetratricopeptide repeat protein [Verrucomicrobiales bacterium]